MQPNTFVSKRLREFIATSQGKSYTVLVVTTVLVLLIVLLGIFPAVSAILLQVEQNNTRHLAVGEIDSKRLVLRDLTAEQNTKPAVVAALNAAIPDGDIAQDKVFTFIQKTMAANQLKFSTVSFGELEKRRSLESAFRVNATIDGMIMNLSADGTRKQIEEFIADLEDSRRIYNIRNLTVRKVDQTSASSIFRMDVQAEIYFWNDEKKSDIIN